MNQESLEQLAKTFDHSATQRNAFSLSNNALRGQTAEHLAPEQLAKTFDHSATRRNAFSLSNNALRGQPAEHLAPDRTSNLRVGGVVLCGGRSSRMGQPKAWLSIGNETSLQRVVRTLREVVSPIVVVSAPGQPLPGLPADVQVVADDDEYLGPLAGLTYGLKALAETADAAFVTACDVPLLKPEFVQAIISELGDADCAVPFEDEQFYHPLAGVYRTNLASLANQLVVSGQLRPLFLIQACQAKNVPVLRLKMFDQELVSLRNINTPEDYAAVLKWLARATGENV